eukprot:TRINITY_DN66730_c0_g1_i1.p1 TRINITY_DN66730_c0_g1~~TRINITY_DN66730_c0_g1_i1.p1  ORF type:complete len:878 (-),score=119.34 TRINITY_DN66730_c0_g1_i1:50-2683(-)
MLQSCTALSMASFPSIISLALASVVEGFSSYQDCANLHVHSFGTSDAELLAAKEVRRYLSLLSGCLPAVTWHGKHADIIQGVRSWQEDAHIGRVVVASRDHPVHAWLGAHDESYSRSVERLAIHPDSHLITTQSAFKSRWVVCAGSSPRATLYAAYSLAEYLGIRFYLTGDVIPEAATNFTLPRVLHRTYTPRFAVRGLQPFHDFPMGPDFWQPEFWRSLATNMAKMKMNFFGFHTYPISGQGITEPLVWIGTEEEYNHSTGAVFTSGAYETSWYQTQDFWATGTRRIRGNVPGQRSVATSSFCCGASLAFERDCYGSAAQADICYPTTKELQAKVFNNAAELIRDAFTWAADNALVDGCVGVEFPLQLPAALAANHTSLQAAYEGIFRRIVDARIPISTFWLWTTEAVENHGTGKGYPQSNPLWKRLVDEINIALMARDAVGAKFDLGTNGWCLGPGDNASFFNDVIKDKAFKVSAISGELGWLPPDPAFAKMDGSRSWVIPWMEDDLALAGAQIWVNRTIAHADLAASYSSSGLLGLMWRTWETSPQVAVLGQAAWSETAENLTDTSFFLDFCSANFGPDVAGRCAELFLQVDSFSASHKPGTGPSSGGSKLRRDGQACCGGPMTVSPVPEANLLNVEGFESWLQTVRGKENFERASAWVNHFRYHRQTQIVSDAASLLQRAMASIHDVSSAQQLGLPIAQYLRDAYTKMITLLLEMASSPGTLGMLAAHEGANWPSKLGTLVTPLSKFLAPEVMATLMPPHAYVGAPRLYRSAVRTVISRAERVFQMEVVVLSAVPPLEVTLQVGSARHAMQVKPDERSGKSHSQVYVTQIEVPDDDFEYFVSAKLPSGDVLRTPVDRNETVVVMVRPELPLVV